MMSIYCHLSGVGVVTAYLVDIFQSTLNPLTLVLVSFCSYLKRKVIKKWTRVVRQTTLVAPSPTPLNHFHFVKKIIFKLVQPDKSALPLLSCFYTYFISSMLTRFSIHTRVADVEGAWERRSPKGQGHLRKEGPPT